MIEKLELKEKIAAVDQNIKELWDKLDDENKKILSREFFILNRYISSVSRTTADVKIHYLLTVNEYFNKNWNDLQKHPKLLWMLLCMCSYDGDRLFYHEWIAPKKRQSTSNKKFKFLSSLYPSMKLDDIETLTTITSDKEVLNLARDYGMDEKEVAKILK